MIPEEPDNLSVLHGSKPAALPAALRGKLLQAMRNAATEEQQTAALAAAFKPTRLSPERRSRFLQAMHGAGVATRRRYRIWWGSSAAAALVLAGVWGLWPVQEPAPAVVAVSAAPRITMQRQVFGGEPGAHRDTFVMEGGDSTRLVIRVTEKAPILLTDDVI